MNITYAKQLELEDLRDAYRKHLESCSLKKNTISTSSNDAFYLWKNGSKDLFWSVLTDINFEKRAREELLRLLEARSTRNPSKLVNGYLSHLRKLKLFIYDNEIIHATATPILTPKKMSVDIPTPCIEQIEYYLAQWEKLENYRLQEDALDRLFFTLCPLNSDISDILIKVATLNNFYSTNIFSVYSVARHILSLAIDDRLKTGDSSLVNDIQRVTISGAEKNFYSFATKYCSHHNSMDFPIYDSYVEKILIYFRDRDGFYNFSSKELKDYPAFKNILIEFQKYYRLDQYNLKQIDKYIWQLGKKFFPKNYGKKSSS